MPKPGALSSSKYFLRPNCIHQQHNANSTIVYPWDCALTVSYLFELIAKPRTIWKCYFVILQYFLVDDCKYKINEITVNNNYTDYKITVNTEIQD